MRPVSEADLLDVIRASLNDNCPLEIMGNGSKRGYGRPVQAAGSLDTTGLAGILAYEPAELVMTVRAGTLLAEIEAALAERRQRLAFEPADWGPLLGAPAGRATIGGIVGANVAGPRRVSHGAARDHVLGARAVSGLGEVFVCGGKVVKNVSGFDLPKLLTGSLGTLAVLSEVTVKVTPRPEETRTLAIAGLGPGDAVKAMNAALSSPWEVSGAAHWRDTTLVRIEGPSRSVAARAEALTPLLAPFGPVTEQDSAIWAVIRDVRPFVGDDRPVWRLILPPARAPQVIAAIGRGEALLDRGGALIWLAVDQPWPDLVRAATEAAGGQATLMRAPAESRTAIPPFHPEPPALAALAARIKHAFDPRRILNPGRMAAGR